MAGVFADSFAHYSFAQIFRKWTYSQSFSGQLMSGRDGRQGLGISSGSIAVTIPHQDTQIVGLATKYPGNPGGVILYHTHVDQTIIGVKVLRDGTLTYTFLEGFPDQTTLGHSDMALQQGIFYYVESKCVISSSGGKIHVDAELRIDGNPVIVVSGTAATSTIAGSLTLGTATFNGLKLGGAGGPGFNVFNDLYILDGNSGINDGFLGDIVVEALYPNGDVGGQNNWTGSSPHYAQINEHIPDDDTTKLTSNTVGQDENFEWEDIATFAGTIPFVHYLICARKDDAGIRKVQLTGDTAATPVGSAGYLNESYNYYRTVMDQDPLGGDWSVSGFNGHKFGFKVVS